MAKIKMDNCVFCGGYRQMSREDIWPCWTTKAVPKPEKQGQHLNVTVGVQPINRKMIELTYREQKVSGDVTASRFRGVCLKCNNGWMSNLEDQTKPTLLPLLLDGASATLGPDDLELLGFWVAKTALMVECLGEPTSQPEAFAYMHRWRRPPPATRIWLGAYGGHPQWDRKLLHVPYRPPGGDHVGTVTFAIGRLAFHVFSAGPTPFRYAPRGRASALRRIWPNTARRAITWPPQGQLGPEDLNHLAHALSAPDIVMEGGSVWIGAKAPSA